MATLEQVREDVWIIRAGEEHRKFGDPYSFACVLLKEEDCYKIKAACGVFGFKTLKSIEVLLRGHGLTPVTWERLGENRNKKVVME